MIDVDVINNPGLIRPSEMATGGSMNDLGITFDHIGLVVHQPTDPWPVLAGALGGRLVALGRGPGYGWTQLRFANGFRVEGLHPEETDDTSDTEPVDGIGPVNEAEEDLEELKHNFLEDFLQLHGAGPHHLTFCVEDLSAAAELLGAHGYNTILKDHEEPLEWSELLIPPSSAHGILVQLLDNVHAGAQGFEDPPDGFPETPIDAPVASLSRVVHAVADLDGALLLFRDCLGGQVVSTGCAIDGNHWVELTWSGPGNLRLLEGIHGQIAEWIGDSPGRIRHLFFSFDEPEYVPGAHRVASGRWVVERDDVLGTRLVLSSSARP